MEALAITLEGLALAEWLRYSRWPYAALNASHILGFSLLVGASFALDLRLLGLWRTIPLAHAYRLLTPVAASGLAIAMLTGVVLFAVRATEYAALTLFFVKLGILAVGVAFAAFVHLRFDLERVTLSGQRLVGLFSLVIWLGLLVTGRFLAFV